MGPKYVSVLGECVRELAKEGFLEEAWQLLDPIEAQDLVSEDTLILIFSIRK